MAALSAYFAARTQSSPKEIFTKIISTHLFFRGGVHYLTLSGLVKPVKSGFSRLCFFIRLHQTVSFLSQMGYEMGYGKEKQKRKKNFYFSIFL